jgi:hypothetical protein
MLTLVASGSHPVTFDVAYAVLGRNPAKSSLTSDVAPIAARRVRQALAGASHPPRQPGHDPRECEQYALGNLYPRSCH